MGTRDAQLRLGEALFLLEHRTCRDAPEPCLLYTSSDIEKLQKLVPQIEQIGIVDSAYTEYQTGDKSYTVMSQGVDSDMLDAVGASKLVAGRTYSQAESCLLYTSRCV